MRIETKGLSADFEVKSDSADTGTFKGYASTFGNLDRDDDIMVAGCFGPLNPKGIKLLWQHNQAEPIGVWTTMREDAKGLYAEGRLALKTQRGAEAYELMKMGALSDMSIGFRTVDAETEKRANGMKEPKRVRKIKKVNLFEVSLVTIPANPLANVDAVKAAQSQRLGRIINQLGLDVDFDPSLLLTEREFERRLRDAGLSRKMAQIMVAEGLDGVKGYLDGLLRDAASLSCKASQIIVSGGYRAFVAKAKQSNGCDVNADPEAEDTTAADADIDSVADDRSNRTDATPADMVGGAERDGGGEGSLSNDRVHLRDADAEAKTSGSELAYDLSFLSKIEAEIKTISGVTQ